MTSSHGTRVAVVTGGSAGLGLALTSTLVRDGWHVVTDARHGRTLADVTAHLPDVTAIAGDVRDPIHQEDLAAEVRRRGRLDLLVHNASELGPMQPLADVAPDRVGDVLVSNVLAPLGLTQRLLPLLHASRGVLVGISSDAAVEHYPTWGAYAASKAALDHVILTLAEENGLRGYAVDPGDMRTAMHQQAFPGEDISDRPLPDAVVPDLMSLLEGGSPSGRYRLADLAVATTGAGR